MSDVWVKVKMPSELHSRFKRWVFDHGTTMQRRIVDLVEDNNGAPVARKQPVVESQSVGETSAPLVDSMSANHHLCSICKISFPELEMEYHSKTMKWACRECAENQRNGQG